MTGLRNTVAQLAEDMERYLFQADRSECDRPTCPLCFDSWADYRALTNDQVDDAWRQAAENYNRVWNAGENKYQPGWAGISCYENWRQRRQENLA